MQASTTAPNRNSEDEVERTQLLESNLHPAAMEVEKGVDRVSFSRAASTSDQSAHEVVVGLSLYALSTLFVSTMSIFAKMAGQRGVPLFEVVLARSVILTGFAFVRVAKGGGSPLGQRQGLLLVRGMCGFAAVSTLYLSVMLLPLSDALVLSFLAPLVVAILSPIAIQEYPSRTVLLAMPACVVGVILIAQPSILFGSAKAISVVGVMVACAQAVFSGCVRLIVRELRKTEQTNVIVLYMGVVSTLGSAFMCLVLRSFVIPRDITTVLLLLGTGLAGYGNQVTMTTALRLVKAAPATAMSYLSVVWGILAGLFVFKEVPTPLSLAGAGLICGSTLLVALVEKRQQATQGLTTTKQLPSLQELLHLLQDSKAGNGPHYHQVVSA